MQVNSHQAIYSVRYPQTSFNRLTTRLTTSSTDQLTLRFSGRLEKDRDALRNGLRHMPLDVWWSAGRDKGNQIVLTDASISQNHLQIKKIGNTEFIIRDVGSTNGTFKDGVRLATNVETLFEQSHTLTLGKHLTLDLKELLVEEKPLRPSIEELDRQIKAALSFKNGYVSDPGNAGFRKYIFGEKYESSPWKLHIFTNGVYDWHDILMVTLPYLQSNHVKHKVIEDVESYKQDFASDFKGQRGKAITVYVRDLDHFRKVATDLSALYRAHNLTVPEEVREYDPGIHGDRALGHTGRLYYRYDKDVAGNYRANDGQYLPKGMTEADDPFLVFKP